MRAIAGAGIAVLVAVASGTFAQARAGDAALDALTSTAVRADPRVVVVELNSISTSQGVGSILSNDGGVLNSVASMAEAAGARAVGFVDFDSLAFSDGGSGRAFIVQSMAIQRIGVIPILDVGLNREVDGVPLVSDYRIDLLSSEVAGIGLPLIDMNVVRSVPAVGRVAALSDGAIAHVPAGGADQAAAAADKGVPGFALRLVELSGAAVAAPSPSSIQLGRSTVPLEGGFLRIRWSSDLDDVGDQAVVQGIDLLADDVDPAIFKDAIVIVGSMDPSQTPFYDTPAGSLPSVLVQANAVNTLLAGTYLVPATLWWTVLCTSILLLPIVALRRSRWRFVTAITGAAGWLLFVHVAAGHGHLFAALVVPVAIVSAAVAMEAIEQLEALAERRQLRTLFTQYVPAAVADRLVGSGFGAAGDDGERLVVTVLFCDLRGFTPLAARLEPSKVRRLLNTYYEQIGSIAFSASGTIMQYTGDEIFVVFGAPLPMIDHASAAVECARSMFAALAELNASLEREQLPSVNFGIGVHSGVVVAAHVGTTFRRQYSVIGDAVNIASRHVSSAGAGQIVVSANTLELVGAVDDGREVELNLKGVDGARSARVIQAGPLEPCALD